MTHWKPYESSESQPWNLARVVHLHRRTVFGATVAEQQRDVTEDPQASVSRILNGTTRLGTPENFGVLSDVIGNSAADSPNPDRLKAWWLYRCLFSPDPLQERLTLMWHNHFATSNLKVNNLRQMKRQNDTLREHSRAPFGELLAAMIRDPALLFWLDAPANRREHPNENLARELLELFTLGLGSYSEQDVRETARALTGWTIRNGEFEEQPAIHDDRDKTVLDQTGNWNGGDIVDILAQTSATANRLAARLVSEFFGEKVVSADAMRELSNVLHETSLDIAATVELMLRSELFFSDANINSRVSDPVSFLIGPLRTLNCTAPPPSTLLLAEWLRRMGQELFYPPNVGGWSGGRTWLSTRTVIGRANYAAALMSGQLHNPVWKPDLESLFDEHGTSVVEFFSQVLGITSLRTINEDEDAASVVVLLMTQSVAHLH